MPSGNGVDSSQDCREWIMSYMRHSSIDCYCPVDIAKEIAPSGSGVDCSQDCSCVDRVLYETKINLLLLSG